MKLKKVIQEYLTDPMEIVVRISVLKLRNFSEKSILLGRVDFEIIFGKFHCFHHGEFYSCFLFDACLQTKRLKWPVLMTFGDKTKSK